MQEQGTIIMVPTPAQAPLSGEVQPMKGDPGRKVGARNSGVQKKYHGQKKGFPSGFHTTAGPFCPDLFS